ncbi:MAG: serine/threonine-protein kinase, partial [bacterium]
MSGRRPVPLGAFDLIAPAASGTTAVIWRAVHRARRVPVAVKVMAPPPERRRARMERLFAHEARAVARLDHPGIVRLFDFGVLPALGDPRLPAGSPYLVMEWIDGGTLERAAGRMVWPALRATLLALLDALAHAHARGVIHQDLKVANVLQARRGPVISDFGIALSPELPAAEPPRLLGTPDYMAPEQVEMKRHALGPWSDLYGLGCVAYALASGLPPFAGRALAAVFDAHVHEAVPPLAPAVEVPAGFTAWVHRLLEKRPEARFRFAADAAAALAALPAGEGPTPVVLRDEAPPLPLPGTGRALFGLRETGLAGREAEQATLTAALAEATAGRARVVLVDGAPGLGKSRLARWIARRAHERGHADHLHAGRDAGGDPLGAMFARHLRATDATGAALHARLDAALDDPALAAELAAALAPDRRFVGRRSTIAIGSPRERHEVFCRALARLAADRPRVLVIDDAHHEAEPLRFVEHLVEAWPTLPVLVVLTACAEH